MGEKHQKEKAARKHQDSIKQKKAELNRLATVGHVQALRMEASIAIRRQATQSMSTEIMLLALMDTLQERRRRPWRYFMSLTKLLDRAVERLKKERVDAARQAAETSRQRDSDRNPADTKGRPAGNDS